MRNAAKSVAGRKHQALLQTKPRLNVSGKCVVFASLVIRYGMSDARLWEKSCSLYNQTNSHLVVVVAWGRCVVSMAGVHGYCANVYVYESDISEGRHRLCAPRKTPSLWTGR